MPFRNMEAALQPEIDHYGYWMPERNNIATAQVVLLVMTTITISLTYGAILRGKVSSASKLSGFYRNLIMTEWLDVAFHVAIIASIGHTNHASQIFVFFEIAHVLTSFFQIKLRITMTKFMLTTAKKYSPTMLFSVVGAPFLLRIILIIIAAVLYLQYDIGGFSWIAVSVGEVISLLYDVVVFEYAHLVSILGRPVTLGELAQALMHPKHSALISLATIGTCISAYGFYGQNDQMGVCQTMGYALLLTTYYAYRDLLLENVENWLLTANLSANSDGRVHRSNTGTQVQGSSTPKKQTLTSVTVVNRSRSGTSPTSPSPLKNNGTEDTV